MTWASNLFSLARYLQAFTVVFSIREAAPNNAFYTPLSILCGKDVNQVLELTFLFDLVLTTELLFLS